MLVDGGRTEDGWVNHQMQFELTYETDTEHALASASDGARSGLMTLWCQRVVRGGIADWDGLCGHSAATATGLVFLFGGSRPTGSLSGDTFSGAMDTVQWIEPVMQKDQYKLVAGVDGEPELFDELIAPPLPYSAHTATLCGDILYVLGGQDAYGAIQLHMLHTPSFSWRLAERLNTYYAPKLSSGHSAALLPQEETCHHMPRCDMTWHDMT